MVSHKTSSHHSFHREGGGNDTIVFKGVPLLTLFIVKLPFSFHCCNHLLFQKFFAFNIFDFSTNFLVAFVVDLKMDGTFVLFLNYCNFVDGTYDKLVLYKKYIIVIIQQFCCWELVANDNETFNHVQTIKKHFKHV